MADIAGDVWNQYFSYGPSHVPAARSSKPQAMGSLGVFPIVGAIAAGVAAAATAAKGVVDVAKKVRGKPRPRRRDGGRRRHARMMAAARKAQARARARAAARKREEGRVVGVGRAYRKKRELARPRPTAERPFPRRRRRVDPVYEPPHAPQVVTAYRPAPPAPRRVVYLPVPAPAAPPPPVVPEEIVPARPPAAAVPWFREKGVTGLPKGVEIGLGLAAAVFLVKAVK